MGRFPDRGDCLRSGELVLRVWVLLPPFLIMLALALFGGGDRPRLD
jgi:hypothetical protein